MKTTSRTSLALVLGITLFTSVARAQGPQLEHAEAARLYREGVTLYEAGKPEEALLKFRQSNAVRPAANPLFAIAKAEQALKRPLEAIGHYRDYLTLADARPADKETAKKAIEELSHLLSRLTIDAPAGASLTLDGKALDAGERQVDTLPGAHVLEATFQGGTERKDVVLQASQSVTETLFSKGPEATAPVTSGSAASTPPVVEPSSRATTERKVAFPPPTGALVLGGVGIVGLGLAVGFDVAAHSSRSDEDSHQCVTARDPQCSGFQSALQRDVTISAVSYVAGGVLLASGIVWWVVAPRKEWVTVGLVPVWSPSFAGAGVRGAF